MLRWILVTLVPSKIRQQWQTHLHSETSILCYCSYHNASHIIAAYISACLLFSLTGLSGKQRIFLQSYASCHLVYISIQEWRFPFQTTFASVELSNGPKYENFSCFVEVLLRLSPSLSLAPASRPPLAKRFDSFFHHSALYFAKGKSTVLTNMMKTITYLLF